MGFRTLEIGQAAELHIKKGQLEVTSEDGIAFIPIEDIEQIMTHGANIRLSTMDMSILVRNKVSIMTLDERYLPTAIVLPFEGHSRQSKLMHAQIRISKELRNELWMEIIRQKIINQSRALSILGKEGAERIAQNATSITILNTDLNEAMAAKEYFQYYHAGMNRRSEDPINSRLNYGYAVIRGYIARTLVATGFHTTFGLHHDSQLNAFNLVDDLIEPYRAMVDLVAYNTIGSNLMLSKSERRAVAHVLHNACMMDNAKVNVMSSIEMMVQSLKRIVLFETSEKLRLPLILPIEDLEGITE